MTDWEIIEKYLHPDRTDADVVRYYERYDADPAFRERVKVFMGYQAWGKAENIQYQSRRTWKSYLSQVAIWLLLGVTYLFLPLPQPKYSEIFYFDFDTDLPLVIRWYNQLKPESETPPAPPMAQAAADPLRDFALSISEELSELAEQKSMLMGGPGTSATDTTLTTGERLLRQNKEQEAIAWCRKQENFSAFEHQARFAFTKEKDYRKAYYYYNIFLDHEYPQETWNDIGGADARESDARLRQMLCILSDWNHLSRYYPDVVKTLEVRTIPAHKGFVENIKIQAEQKNNASQR